MNRYQQLDGVQTRIPAGSKVLLCTTTNKAIDSLAEKIYKCGHRDILAFGNASRLGETSLQLTLSHRVAAHESVRGLQEFETAVERALSLWERLEDAAEDASGGTSGSVYDDELKRLIKRNVVQLQGRVADVMRAKDEFIDLPQHPESVSNLILGALIFFLCLMH